MCLPWWNIHPFSLPRVRLELRPAGYDTNVSITSTSPVDRSELSSLVVSSAPCQIDTKSTSSADQHRSPATMVDLPQKLGCIGQRMADSCSPLQCLCLRGLADLGSRGPSQLFVSSSPIGAFTICTRVSCESSLHLTLASADTAAITSRTPMRSTLLLPRQPKVSLGIYSVPSSRSLHIKW